MGCKQSSESTITELLNEVNELRKQNTALLSMEKRRNSMSSILCEYKKTPTNINKDSLRLFVSKMLDKEEINMGYIPDFVEKKLYENILNIILNIIDNILSETSIKIFNHKIVFDVIAEPEEKEKTEDK